MGEVRIDTGDCVWVFPEQDQPTAEMIENVYKTIAQIMVENDQ